MFCTDFEDQLTDYLDGALAAEAHREFAEHALQCHRCRETLSEVKSALQACKMAAVPPPSFDLEASILQETTPEVAMNCEDFENFLTDYLDGFLPAPLFHRWERHAAVCAHCTELPGEVVRSIGACYTYIGIELAVPEGLNERILQATLGTVRAEELRAPWSARLAAWLRGLLDPIVSPQLATVATMLLVAVFVLTNTVSADGSIGGVYQASVRLAERTAGTKTEIKEVTQGLKELVGGEPAKQQPAEKPAKPEPQQQQQKNQKQQGTGQNNR